MQGSAFNEESSPYEVLEVSPDASPQDIREAYLRLKAAYGKDSPALYSLVTPQERDQHIREIEKAYDLLSDPQKRKEFDQNNGLSEDEPLSPINPMSNVVRIRSATPNIDETLDPPGTDFSEPSRSPTKPVTLRETDGTDNTTDGANEEATETAMKELLKSETEWKGPSIKKAREIQGVSIEELAEFTKIGKRYLKAIEADQFKELPAVVFLRGFLIQISKKLKLPHEAIAAAYLARYKQSRPEKN